MEPKRALVNAVTRALIWLATEHVPEACCFAHRVYSSQKAGGGWLYALCLLLPYI